MRDDRLRSLFWLILGIAAIAVSIPVVFWAAYLGLPAYYSQRGYGMIGEGFFGLVSLFLPFLGVFAAVAMIGLIWLLASEISSERKERRKLTPLEILEKRYAAGEISRNDYLEKLEDLRKNR